MTDFRAVVGYCSFLVFFISSVTFAEFKDNLSDETLIFASVVSRYFMLTIGQTIILNDCKPFEEQLKSEFIRLETSV